MEDGPLPITSQSIHLDEYTYTLPEERIAAFPLAERDHSKVLVYRRGQVEHGVFYQLDRYIPDHSLLVFNDTKVIPARLYFRRATGAVIEIFLLQPQPLDQSIHAVMQMRGSCTWRCMIGNKKKWKDGEVLQQEVTTADGSAIIKATLVDRETQDVRFEWEPALLSFAKILPQLGEIPLPPYLNRKATEQDKEQYQTLYARKEGAVAAPTAGLHFTDRVLQSLTDKGISTDYITLHVGAGTFQPIKAENVIQHPMHAEQIIFTRKNLELLLKHSDSVIAVGTTSMRALESLYWYGLRLMNGQATHHLFVEKLYPYGHSEGSLPAAAIVFQKIHDYMKAYNLEEIVGETEILIVPGYTFRVCKGLITNFHLPGSTLILLVAAFIGQEWRRVYEEALATDYRFLSYGDSSILLPS